MEKIEKYKNCEIKVELLFNATEQIVRDKNDRDKLLNTVTYEYSQNISINNCIVLHNNGRTYYDENMPNLSPEIYVEMILNNGIFLGKNIIDEK